MSHDRSDISRDFLYYKMVMVWLSSGNKKSRLGLGKDCKMTTMRTSRCGSDITCLTNVTQWMSRL